MNPEDGNKNSKGHDMFLKRAKKSGDTMEFEPEIPKHDKTPNLKLVMNPEGKLHDWQDLPEEEVPEMDDLVNTGNPEVAHTLGMMVQNLNEEKGRGGELFAERRKKADKWVVDENQIGLGDHPSQFADEFITQQNTAREQFVREKEEEFQAQQQVRDEADAQQRAEQQEYQQQQQQIFQEQQMMKQQQSVQIKQQQASRKQSLSADLPPNYQHCSLKGRPFTPSMDLGIHNVQGIDVWTTKGPKPYGKAGAQIRTATQKLPPKLEPQPEQELPQLEVVQTKDVTDHVQIEQKSSSSTTTATTVETTSSNHVKDEEMRMKQELEMQRKAEEERMEQERKRQVEEEQRRLQAERAQQEQAQQMEMQRQQAEFQKQQAEMQRRNAWNRKAEMQQQAEMQRQAEIQQQAEM